MLGTAATIVVVILSVACQDVRGQVTEQAASKATLDITELMDDGERRRCGIEKLSERELTNLNTWLTNYTTRLATLAHGTSAKTKHRAVAEVPEFSNLKGAVLVANDGQYLGTIDNRFASDSIVNDYGTFGNPYSATSIHNEYGSYGGKYSNLSPFNSYTSTPPSIFLEKEFVAYLTTNEALSPRIDPRALVGWLKSRQ